MAQLKNTDVNGNLNVTEDIKINSNSITENLNQLNADISNLSSNISTITLNQLLSNPKAITSSDNILDCSPGMYKWDNAHLINGTAANSVYIIGTG